MPSVEQLMAYAAYVRDIVNPSLFAYALSCALLHRSDTKNLKLPTVAQIFPKIFLTSEAVAEAQQRANVLKNPNDRVSI